MKGIIVLSIALFLAALNSCDNDKAAKVSDTPVRGTIHISVDESFKPVIDEEIKVYESSYPDAHIIPEYKSEADCFRDLEKDSTRLIIVARGLTDAEDLYFTKKLQFKPLWDLIAYDAVSMILNIKSVDSVFTIVKLKKLLSDSLKNKEAVVDGSNATSTVRFLLDSVLKGKPFSKNVRAAQGSKAVLDYVSNNINAVGFVGSCWVGDDEDPEQRAYDDKIKLALIQCEPCGIGYFAKPSQETITLGQYPLVRPLYYVLKENYAGLGTGFTGFLGLERGQLIFRRDNLVPAKMNFSIRKTSIK